MFQPLTTSAKQGNASEEKEVFTRTVPTIDGETCDACGSQAVGASYHAGREDKNLFFCAHHIRQFADKLKVDGFEITPSDISFTAGVAK